MIKLGIVDDQELITEGLKRILSTYEDIQVVVTGKNGEEALEICRAYTLDVLLMDIRMPKMNGVESIRLIKEEGHPVKVIMLTTFEDEEYIVKAISYGASGYLYKDIPYDKLAQCIREVYEGQFMMPQKVAQVLAKNIGNSTPKIQEVNPYNLTEREIQIVEMIEEGFNNKQIAKALYISEGTVKNYVSNIYAKTETKSRIELVHLLNQIEPRS
ncbi:MAG: response regulator transcription factor [Cellulosilyticum sp.]|nr:response regulator transcription factor [Cellulosilyticum sp.]